MPQISQFANINTISDISPSAQKPGGTKDGFVGVKDGIEYLVKINATGYSNAVAGKASEAAAIESFTAQFIRAVWGKEFATDIRVAKLPQAPVELEIDRTQQSRLSTLSAFPEGMTSFKSEPGGDYAVVSVFEKAAKKFGNDHYSGQISAEERANILKMEAIVRILRVSDHKDENVLMISGKPSLIDCGAFFPRELDDSSLFKKDFTYDLDNDHLFDDLDMREKHLSRIDPSADQQAIKSAIAQFTQFKEDDLIELVDQYKGILSSETLDTLYSQILSLQSDVERKHEKELSEVQERTTTADIFSKLDAKPSARVEQAITPEPSKSADELKTTKKIDEPSPPEKLAEETKRPKPF